MTEPKPKALTREQITKKLEAAGYKPHAGRWRHPSHGYTKGMLWYGAAVELPGAKAVDACIENGGGAGSNWNIGTV